MQAARRNRERTLEVTEQLASPLADPHPSLRGVAARPESEQVTMVSADDAAKSSRNREIGLGHRPRARGKQIANIPQHALRLRAQALPVHPAGQHDQQVKMDRDEHQLRTRYGRDRRPQRDRVAPLGVAVDADRDARDRHDAKAGAVRFAAIPGSRSPCCTDAAMAEMLSAVRGHAIRNGALFRGPNHAWDCRRTRMPP